MKLFKHFSKRTTIFAAGVLIALAAIATVPVLTKAVSGPDRPTKAYSDGVAGFDHVTFNSFTGVPDIGDERNFFNGKYEDAGSVYSDPMANVKNGDILTLEVYVHNNADPSLNDAPGNPGVAQNTQVRVALPTGIATNQEATAYISADNAQPQTVTDTLDFGADNGGNFALNYVAGSAHVKGNYIDQAISDNVVTSGAAIGTDALDGKVKGCFQQMVYVTIQVKVTMPEYSLTKQVRMNGQTSKDWTKTENVQAGDRVQWLLTFKNNGSTPLSSVGIVDQVPAGLTVVPGSVKLINGNYGSGYTFPDSAIQDNGRMIAANIGDYNPDAAGIAYLMYDTTIDQPAATVCAAETLTNKAFATPGGLGAIYDTATVTVPGNTCATATPTYSCNLLSISKGDNRTITASVAYAATNGAKLSTVTYNYGDGSTPLTTDKTTTSYQYAKDGTYAITATLTFDVNGTATPNVTSASCAQSVTFASKTTTTPPTELPNTGAGNVIGLFAGAVVAGTIGYRLFLGRKLARR